MGINGIGPDCGNGVARLFPGLKPRAKQNEVPLGLTSVGNIRDIPGHSLFSLGETSSSEPGTSVPDMTTIILYQHNAVIPRSLILAG